MYATRLIGSIILLTSLLTHATAQEKGKPGPATKDGGKQAVEAGMVEARFTDNSTLKLAMRDPHLELTTPYGKLLIPFGDIHRIEVGWRATPEVLSRVERAVTQLASPSFKEREAASAELMTLKEKSYPALLKIVTHADPEV